MNMKNSYKVALGGIIAALSLAIMLASGLIPIGTYALPALSGIVLIPLVIEAGRGWAITVFCAVSVLSMVLAPDKEAAVCFVVFFGYYPVLKSLIEILKSGIFQYAVKLAVFNAAMISAFFIAVNLLSVPEESFSIGGVNVPLLFLLAGNIAFVAYDYAITLLVGTYINRIRGRFFKNKIR